MSSVTFDPTIRYTFWSMFIGGTVYATASSCVLQTQVQRYMCVSSTREAQKYNSHVHWLLFIRHVCRATWINNIMCFLLMLLCGLVGLLIYAKYHDCDPLKAKHVSRSDQV